jgi:hypothetical protein
MDEEREQLRAEFLANISERTPFADSDLDLEKAGVDKNGLAKGISYNCYAFPVMYRLPYFLCFPDKRTIDFGKAIYREPAYLNRRVLEGSEPDL